jgi:type III secretion system FlhB-like substrate exporter
MSGGGMNQKPESGTLSLADEIVALARESGRQVSADTDLALLLEDMAGDMQINVPVLLALSEIATPLFRYEMTENLPAPRPDDGRGD